VTPAVTPKSDAKDDKDKSKKDKEPTPEERATRGVVVIERSGQAIALGGVLAGDGRVITALSPLGAGNDLDARFPDGTTVRVKLGHHDRMWDLALLVPQSGKWPDGLIASAKDPVRQDASIHAFTLQKSKATITSITVRAHKAMLGGDDKLLDNALELGSRVSPTDLGAPLVDEDGRVVGVMARGCAQNDKGPCTPVAYGAPIGAIKTFLRNVPATAVAPSAWLGIQGVSENGSIAKGVRVLVVHPESPADEAKLKGGDRASSDVILAVDGVPVTTPETLADAVHAHAIGEKIPLTIFSEGKYKTVNVTLKAAPEPGKSASPPSHPAELPPADPPKEQPKKPLPTKKK
jgi:serine protease Do